MQATPDVPPVLLDRYRIEQVLGEGGQAVVFRAQDLRLGVPRALKVMLPQAARKKKLRARFEAEAQTMARIEHPNIIRVFDVETAGAVPFFVMEFVTGGSLADRLQHGPIPPRLAVRALEQICEGLAAAHDAGVVHRDVKPHNVLVTSAGVCKVVDFGIARLEGSSKTKAGLAIGTQGFMAPEQVLDAASVDARSDLYGVGMTAFVLLTGRDPVEWIAGIRRGVPEALQAILSAATANAKEDRPPDARTLAAAFSAAAAGLPPDPPGATLVVEPVPPPPDEAEERAARMRDVRTWFSTPLEEDSSASLLGAPPRPIAAPSIPPTRLGPPPAGYTMSKPKAVPKDVDAGKPDWLSEEPAREDAFTAAREASPASGGASLVQEVTAAERAAAAKPPPEEPPDALAQFGQLLTRIPLWAPALLLVALAAGVGLVYVRLEAREARQKARDEATSQLVEVVRHDLGVLGMLEQLGSDSATLTGLESEFHSARTDAERAATGAKLAAFATEEMNRLTQPGSAQRKALQGPVEEMNLAVTAWQRAQADKP